ncbi:hypothetical protein A8938_1502 [Algoriphagus zhangzhouensis]|uniref:Uncharacterized protein n=1 Tax=Algoriphagus zhangzhouensis TaxID=1073327 RepID=A0A1M7ZAQ0_9BACT|nr:hypothetical protein A8938_1502 [Algoriphagus zhangzhouensis]SHO61991.1 hypothetical protein SAMN04488108_1760 [Algoriphagus zhangzhouensis]
MRIKSTPPPHYVAFRRFKKHSFLGSFLFLMINEKTNNSYAKGLDCN